MFTFTIYYFFLFALTCAKLLLNCDNSFQTQFSQHNGLFCEWRWVFVCVFTIAYPMNVQSLMFPKAVWVCIL